MRDRKIEHTVLEPAQPPKYEPPKPEAEVGKKPEVSVLERTNRLMPRCCKLKDAR